MFKVISAKDIDINLIKAIADEYMLIAAGDKSGFNMMPASWGFTGEMWGNDCAVAMIRPQRYTWEFIKKNDYFTLSFYGDRKDVHKICGSKSGRDVNKAELAGLDPVFEDGTVYFEQARLVLICKKQYIQQLEADCFTDKEPLRWYNDDLHYMVVGKIEKVLVKE